MNQPGKIPAFLTYLLLFFGWIYVFVAHRDNKLAIYHTKQSIMLVLTAISVPLIWAIIGWLLSFIIPYFGFVFAIALFALAIVILLFLALIWIIGMTYALKAEFKPLPVVGGWAEQLPIG